MTSLYDKDFHQWIQQNISLLRQGRLAEIDTDILIDELENMARSNQRELVSHLNKGCTHNLVQSH